MKPRILGMFAHTLLCAVLCLGALTACANEEPAQTQQAKGVEQHEYTVRARVTALPDPANPMSEFSAHHEEIPDFHGQGGERGMKAMVMPFPLDENLSLEGLEVGDIVALTFVVDYNADEDRLLGYCATRWEKLPPDTKLNLTTGADSSASDED